MVGHQYKNVALVLSGGGANGAFQVTAERYCREVMGFEWSVIAGQSVGALNGAMLAMGKYEELLTMWKEIQRKDIYTTKPSIWQLAKAIATGRLGLSSNKPLLRLIERHVVPAEIKIPFRFGAVDLQTGGYVRFTEEDVSPHLLRASASIPIVWPPVGPLVDGGLLNNGPISDVLSFDPDLIIIINCKPRVETDFRPMPRNLIHKAGRVLDIVLDEAFRNDFEAFLHLNDVLKQIEAHNDQLPWGEEPLAIYHRSGRPYRAFEYVFIEPSHSLGSALDFDSDKIKDLLDMGYARAESAFNQWQPS